MDIGFVCWHGWGFDHTFLEPLGEFLLQKFPRSPIIYENRGYFSPSSISAPPSLPLDTRRLWIGIGHSFGFSHLLSSQVHGLVSLNGFTRFCRHEGSTHGTSHRVLHRMLTKFQTAPQAVLRDFYLQCGIHPEDDHPFPDLNEPLLYEDLQELQSLDITAIFLTDNRPVLSLHGQNDILVSSDLWQETMGSKKGMISAVHPQGNHGLGQTNALWCAQQIEQWMKNEFGTIPLQGLNTP